MTVSDDPDVTVCTPEGDTVPFAPDEIEMVNPAAHAPDPVQIGFAGSLLLHCVSVVHAEHEFVA